MVHSLLHAAWLSSSPTFKAAALRYAMRVEDLGLLPVAKLREELRNRGIPVKGLKTDLVHRLQAALEAEV